MTILSKVKTLIEYARFGMGVVQARKNQEHIVFFPKPLTEYVNDGLGILAKATELRGYVVQFGGNYLFKGNTTLKIVDLPRLITFRGGQVFANSMVEVCRLPSLRVAEVEHFLNCTNLKIIEFGTLTRFSNNMIKGCTALHTVIVGEGTACNLFLQYSKELTQECLHGIIDAFEDRNGSSALTLHIYDVCAQRISDEYKQKAADKNINILEVKSQ